MLHSFRDLTGPRLLNHGCAGSCIEMAVQAVAFRLDERGERSPVAPVDAARGMPGRCFVFDGPFLLCLREPGAPLPTFCTRSLGKTMIYYVVDVKLY